MFEMVSQISFQICFLRFRSERTNFGGGGGGRGWEMNFGGFCCGSKVVVEI